MAPSRSSSHQIYQSTKVPPSILSRINVAEMKGTRQAEHRRRGQSQAQSLERGTAQVVPGNNANLGAYSQLCTSCAVISYSCVCGLIQMRMEQYTDLRKDVWSIGIIPSYPASSLWERRLIPLLLRCARFEVYPHRMLNKESLDRDNERMLPWCGRIRRLYIFINSARLFQPRCLVRSRKQETWRVVL